MNYSIYKKEGKEKPTKTMEFQEIVWNYQALKWAKLALKQIREAHEQHPEIFSVEQPTTQRLIVKDANNPREENTIQYFIKRERTTRQ